MVSCCKVVNDVLCLVVGSCVLYIQVVNHHQPDSLVVDGSS